MNKPMLYILFLTIFNSIELCLAEDLPQQLVTHIIGTPQVTKFFTDLNGKHLLCATKSKIHDNTKDSDRLTLRAYLFNESNGIWKQEWIIKDWVDCPGLDLEGSFLPEYCMTTDLDSNGITETTVSYYLLCSGDISPKTIKTILREGELKYAVRGESTVIIGKEKYGGTFTYDPSLKKNPTLFIHLTNVWKKVEQQVSQQN